MDHQEQHHLKHRKEREHEKKEHLQHEREAERTRRIHPAIFIVGAALALAAMLVWMFFLFL